METFDTTDSLTQLFTQDLTNVDLSAPLIVAGPVDWDIADMKIADTKDGDKKLEITLKTAYVTRGTKGETFQPGKKLIHNISLKPIDKNGEQREERIKQDLKRLRLAAGFGSGAFGSPSDYIGKRISTVISVEVDKEGKYADKNVISKWIEAR